MAQNAGLARNFGAYSTTGVTWTVGSGLTATYNDPNLGYVNGVNWLGVVFGGGTLRAISGQ